MLIGPALLADLRIPSRCKVLPAGPCPAKPAGSFPVPLPRHLSAGTGFVATSSSVPAGSP